MCTVFLSQEWTKLERPEGASWPLGTSSHAACCLNYGEEHPQLLVTGGVDKNDNTLQDVWILDVNSGRWREVSDDVHMNVWLVQLTEPANLTPYLSPAHPSCKYTGPTEAHCYCIEFGARANTSHHVWRMSKVWEGKVILYSTETSQNYCAGLWWAEHTRHFSIAWCYRSLHYNLAIPPSEMWTPYLMGIMLRYIPYTRVNKRIRLFSKLQGNVRLLPNMCLIIKAKIDHTPKHAETPFW